jgi:hypothetical protein
VYPPAVAPPPAAVYPPAAVHRPAHVLPPVQSPFVVPAPPEPVPTPTYRVGLVLGDGQHIALTDGDPRSDTFHDLASRLLGDSELQRRT